VDLSPEDHIPDSRLGQEVAESYRRRKNNQTKSAVQDGTFLAADELRNMSAIVLALKLARAGCRLSFARQLRRQNSRSPWCGGSITSVAA
jgi:hypothetical protein